MAPSDSLEMRAGKRDTCNCQKCSCNTTEECDDPHSACACDGNCECDPYSSNPNLNREFELAGAV